MFRKVPLSIVRSFSLYTQQWYTSYRFVDSLRAGSGRNSQAVSKPVWHIPLLCVQWKTPDDGQRNCLKHVKLNSKNNFEKLVHLVVIFYEFITMHCHLNVKLDYKQNTFTELQTLVSQISDSMAFCPQCAPSLYEMRFLRWWWRLLGLWMLCHAVRQTYADVSGSSAASFRLEA